MHPHPKCAEHCSLGVAINMGDRACEYGYCELQELTDYVLGQHMLPFPNGPDFTLADDPVGLEGLKE